jgi:hypothetical protein
VLRVLLPVVPVESVELPVVLALELDVAEAPLCGSIVILTRLSVTLSSISCVPIAKFSALVAAEGFGGPAIAAWYVFSAVSASDVLLSFTAVPTEFKKALRGSDVPVPGGGGGSALID